MDFQEFLKEKSHLPKEREVWISDHFKKEGQPILWSIRAMTEGEYQKRREKSKDAFSALCLGAVVFPDLTDEALWESYGVDNGEDLLKEMLSPGEYIRLLEAVQTQNGFQKRRQDWKHEAKNGLRRV